MSVVFLIFLLFFYKSLIKSSKRFDVIVFQNVVTIARVSAAVPVAIHYRLNFCKFTSLAAWSAETHQKSPCSRLSQEESQNTEIEEEQNGAIWSFEYTQLTILQEGKLFLTQCCILKICFPWIFNWHQVTV